MASSIVDGFGSQTVPKYRKIIQVRTEYGGISALIFRAQDDLKHSKDDVLFSIMLKKRTSLATSSKPATSPASIQQGLNLRLEKTFTSGSAGSIRPPTPVVGQGRVEPCPALSFPSKPSFPGVRVSLRGNPLSPPVFGFCVVSHFPLKTPFYWPLQGLKNRPKIAFWAKSLFPELICWTFFGHSRRFRIFNRFESIFH